MALNGLGHFEDLGLPGYTELGALAGRTSVLGTGHEGPRALWEDAVYHRMVLLEPRLQTHVVRRVVGRDVHGHRGHHVRCERADRGAGPAPLASGRSARRPTAFGGGEMPDPRDAVPGDAHVGYLLSVNVNGPWFSTLGSVLTGVSLTPDGGAPVAVTGVDRTDAHGGYLSGGFALFPHQPLAEATWYTARASGYVTGIDVGPSRIDYAFDISWRSAHVGAGPDPDPGATGRPAVRPPARPRSAIATALAVSGKLRAGTLAATVTVKPAGKRTLTILVQRPERRCSGRRAARAG